MVFDDRSVAHADQPLGLREQFGYFFAQAARVGARHGRSDLHTLVTWLGVFVLLALILPTSFWWFVLGAVLIYVGACVIR